MFIYTYLMPPFPNHIPMKGLDRLILNGQFQSHIQVLRDPFCLFLIHLHRRQLITELSLKLSKNKYKSKLKKQYKLEKLKLFVFVFLCVDHTVEYSLNTFFLYRSGFVNIDKFVLPPNNTLYLRCVPF